MFKILVVDSSAIDRRMMHDVLEKKFAQSVALFSATEGTEASELVKNGDIDLLIVNIPYYSIYSDFAEVLIHNARNVNGNISLILVSVKKEERIARMATRFNADGYLLKPYRREQLTALVENIMAQSRRSGAVLKEKAEDEDFVRYLKLLENFIHECDYKKSKNIAKEYLSLIYADSSAKNIRSGIINFAQGISELGRWYGNDDLQRKLENCLERFFTNYNVQVRRFESTEIIEEMIDFIFVELEKFQTGSGDELKKVLNYIELNIKNGITLDSAAEHINMSPSYFSKVFKKAMGTNFIVYVTDRRIEIAKEMLQNTDMPVINIACELSYNETNYFSKVFKKKVGLSPTEYRQRVAADKKVGG